MAHFTQKMAVIRFVVYFGLNPHNSKLEARKTTWIAERNLGRNQTQQGETIFLWPAQGVVTRANYKVALDYPVQLSVSSVDNKYIHQSVIVLKCF